MVESFLAWSYGSIVQQRLPKIDSLLDLGTGGGELLSLFSPLPKLTCATEAYAPNFQIARKRLEPLEVKVYHIKDDDHLPFSDATFDLVIDRHESYSEEEVRRIMKPRGEFITQQVGEKNEQDLLRILGLKKSRVIWDLKHAASRLKRKGFKIIEAREDFPSMRFYDTGALVYYLKAVSHPGLSNIPDFSVEGYFQALRRINELIREAGYLELANHRCLIIARKV